MPYGRLPTLTIRDTPKERSRFEMKFDVADTDVSIANAIRRTMIAEVPTMAIDLVTVIENTSPLHDEYIVHRLGLIPLTSDRVDEFEFAHDCEECDDHCPRCSVTFELKVVATPEPGIVRKVTSKDLQCMEADSSMISHSVVPVHDSGDDSRGASNDTGILIAKLTRSQRIHMTALARKGLGKDHAKWSPMCTVAYRIIPPAVELVLDKMNAMYSKEQKDELVVFSQGLLRLDDTTGNLDYETPFKMGRIAVTPDAVRKSGELAIAAGGSASEVVRYNHKPQRFEFTAETTGSVSPKRALAMALHILQRKIDALSAHQR